MKNFFKDHIIDISLTMGSIFIACFLHWFGIFDFAELKTYDYRFHSVRGPLTGWRAADSTIIDIGTDVVMVDVDDEAWRLLQEKKVPWPYPRGDIWARVVDNLSAAGAKVIAVAGGKDKVEQAKMLGADHVVDHQKNPDRSLSQGQLPSLLPFLNIFLTVSP